MKTDSGLKESVSSSGRPAKQRAFGWPATRLGWWSVGLAAVFIVFWIAGSALLSSSTALAPWWQVVLPFASIFMVLCGLAGGITGLIAVIRRHERSLLVWLAILAGLFVLAFVLAEVLIP